MADVNPGRAGRPTLREERAAVTRARILEAARRLFFREGYAATTLKSIALEAGVAVQTVYAVFGSKLAILDDLRALVVDQPEADGAFREAASAPTTRERLLGFARSIRLRWELGGDVVRVHQDAARADPSVRAGMAEAEGRRAGGIARFVRDLDADFRLGLDVDRTRAVVHALTLSDVYAELVGVQGWSPDDYERWLGAELVAAVERERVP